MSLTKALQEHKERRKKDTNAVMTMVINRSKPSPLTRQSRFGTDELFVTIDPNTKQLLSYEENTKRLKGTLSLDKMLLVDNSSLSLHNDMQVVLSITLTVSAYSCHCYATNLHLSQS